MGPDKYQDDDDTLMDSLMDAMEGYDADHQVQEPTGAGHTIVEVHVHADKPADAPKEEEKPETGDDALFPTPEELEEMSKMSA